MKRVDKKEKDTGADEITITEANNEFGDEIKPEGRQLAIFWLNIGAAAIMYTSGTYTQLTAVNALV